MRERAIKFLSVLFITSSLLVALFPFFIVSADSPTYKVITECTQFYPGGNYYYSVNKYLDYDIRAVYLKDPNSTDFYGWVVGPAVSDYWMHIQTSNRGSFPVSCGTSGTGAAGYITVNNIKYGYRYYYIGGVSSIPNNGVPVISDSNFSTSSRAVYYTYGDGAIDPEPPAPPAPTYGNLILNGYSTDIAGQGEASLGNIDHIKWDNSSDTLGNDISNLKVRLQIVPGTYYGDSKAQLLSQTYEDMIIDINNAHEQVYDVLLGEISFNWSDIVDWLNITSYKLWSAQLFGVNWEKEGWIYRIRLEDPEYEFVGNWQTVYSSTSSGVENDFTIINSSTIDQTYINALQEVNNLNTVNNNWTFNNTEISVTNEYTEPQLGEKPWWAYLLESIFNTLNITNNYINEGNDTTINISNNVNNSDDQMNNKINEYQDYEHDFITDMDDNLTDIDTDVPLLSDNKFINSANWVAQQYNRMTNNTVIGSLIGFSLVFGIALIFIGKIR